MLLSLSRIILLSSPICSLTLENLSVKLCLTSVNPSILPFILSISVCSFVKATVSEGLDETAAAGLSSVFSSGFSPSGFFFLKGLNIFCLFLYLLKQVCHVYKVVLVMSYVERLYL